MCLYSQMMSGTATFVKQVSVCVCFRFEKYTRDGNTMYATVGYLTAYSYYAYPANIRPRLRSVPHLMANAHSDQA